MVDSQSRNESVSTGRWFGLHLSTLFLIAFSLTVSVLIGLPKQMVEYVGETRWLAQPEIYEVHEYGWPFVYRRTLEFSGRWSPRPMPKFVDLDSFRSEFRSPVFELKSSVAVRPDQRIFSSADNWNFFNPRVESQPNFCGLAANVLIYLGLVSLLGFCWERRVRTRRMFVYKIREILLFVAMLAGIVAWVMFQIDGGRNDKSCVEQILQIARDTDAIEMTFDRSSNTPREQWESRVPSLLVRMTDNRFQLSQQLRERGFRRVVRLELDNLKPALATDPELCEKTMELVAQLTKVRELIVSPGPATSALFEGTTADNIKHVTIIERPLILNRQGIVNLGTVIQMHAKTKDDWSWLGSFPNLELIDIKIMRENNEQLRHKAILTALPWPEKLKRIRIDGRTKLKKKQWDELSPRFPSLEETLIEFLESDPKQDLDFQIQRALNNA